MSKPRLAARIGLPLALLTVSAIATADTLPAQPVPTALRPAGPTVAPALKPAGQPALCTNEDKIRIDRFWSNPISDANAAPLAGRAVQIWAIVANLCNTTLPSIRWTVQRSSEPLGPGLPYTQETILQGTYESLGPNEIRGIQLGTWTAIGGKHNFVFDVDADNVLHDAINANNRKSITDYVVNVAPNWAAWGPAARVAAQQGTNRWLGGVEVRGKVNASVLTFGKGNTLVPPAGPPFDAQPMVNAGAPAQVIVAFSSVTWDAWTSYIGSYAGPSNPVAFPTFAAFAGTQAPPTPAAPPSLSVLAGPSSNDSSMSAESLANALKAKLGAAAMAQPGAAAAVMDYATYYHDHFVSWRKSATLSNLLGRGPVSGFAPPAMPFGHVVDGPVTGKVGGGF